MSMHDYPARLAVEAIRLHDGGRGLDPGEIRHELERRGIARVPATSTIHRWVTTPESLEVREDRRRREYQRMLQLRDAGLSLSGIAVVMTVDFGRRVTKRQVYCALKNERVSAFTSTRHAA